MADPPVPRTFVAGEVETESYLNAGLRDPITFLRQKPICTVYTSGAVSIANSAVTTLTFDSTLLDVFNMHNPGVNPGRITAVYSGWYTATAVIGWAGATAGYRQAKIIVNDAGSPYGEVDVPSVGANGMYLNVKSVPFYLNTNSYATVQVWQNSTNPLNVGATSFFSLEWVSA